MAISSAICNSFKQEILVGTHNFTASSGNTFNDRAALRAIKSASPFERLPYQYNLSYLLIHFEFIWE